MTFRAESSSSSHALRVGRWLLIVATVVAAVGFHPSAGAQEGRFLRGDPNQDAAIDLSDAVVSLGHLFTGGAAPSCLDAADTDDSGSLDLSDPVSLLGFLFLNGPAPSAPYPNAGQDPTSDNLRCHEPDPGDLAPLDPPADADTPAGLQMPLRRTHVSWSRGGAVRVNGATFDRLLGAGGGADEAPDRAWIDTFLNQAFGGARPRADGPVVRVRNVAVAGKKGDDCYWLSPGEVDAGSYDRVPAQQFLRGDLDDNGEVTVDDARALRECVQGLGPCRWRCLDAGDANDDGAIDMLDVPWILNAALEGTPLPAPATGLGPDPTRDNLVECPGAVLPGAGGTLRLSIEPEFICEAGMHEVTLTASDRDGNRTRSHAWVLLCEAENGECLKAPLPQPKGVVSEPAPDEPQCLWIVEETVSPEEGESELGQENYGSDGSVTRRDAPPLAASGAMTIWRYDNGPGAVHFLTTSRLNASCKTPASNQTAQEHGSTRVRIGAFCIAPDETFVACDGEIEAEGTFHAVLEVGTDLGPKCSGTTRLEALSEENASLSLNGRTLFQKGASIQNGVEVTESESQTTRFSPLAIGPGRGASVGVEIGASVTRENKTGNLQDEVVAFGNSRADLPGSVSLTAQGKVLIRADQRTFARARDDVRVSGFWLVADADCPVPSPYYHSWISGEEDEVNQATGEAARFRRTRLGY